MRLGKATPTVPKDVLYVTLSGLYVPDSRSLLAHVRLGVCCHLPGKVILVLGTNRQDALQRIPFPPAELHTRLTVAAHVERADLNLDSFEFLRALPSSLTAALNRSLLQAEKAPVGQRKHLRVVHHRLQDEIWIP